MKIMPVGNACCLGSSNSTPHPCAARADDRWALYGSVICTCSNSASCDLGFCSSTLLVHDVGFDFRPGHRGKVLVALAVVGAAEPGGFASSSHTLELGTTTGPRLHSAKPCQSDYVPGCGRPHQGVGCGQCQRHGLEHLREGKHSRRRSRTSSSRRGSSYHTQCTQAASM